jgi:hypothetical protein
MFIELIDSLRCIVPHEETWLVASVARMDGRHVVDGVLGCPICHREYAIRDGTAWFTATLAGDATSSLTIADESGDEDAVVRAAALLGLTEPGGIVIVGGPWTSYAAAIAAHGAAHAVTLNVAARDAGAQEISALVVEAALPFGTASVRGIGLGEDLASPALLASAARVLRSRGRLVAPADSDVPEGVTVLARDTSVWVGERTVAASPPVSIRSARR